MLKIGLTGGIGSGKTVVSSVFAHLGIPVFSADRAAKELLDNDPSVRQKVVRIFGKEIVQKNAVIDKKQLAEIVFSNESRLEQLNAILHPVTRKKYRKWLTLLSGVTYSIKEAAILFESGAHRDIDATILVYAPREVRIRRVMERDKVSRNHVLARMKQQWSDSRKKKMSDYTIYNDGKRMLLPQVLKIDRKLNS